MKKITKIMITLSSILAMAGASMFAVNHKMEQDNKDHIQDVYNQKQRSEDENIEIVADRYAQKEEYKRNEILNNKSFDASLLGSNFEFLKNRQLLPSTNLNFSYLLHLWIYYKKIHHYI